jgi:hypothetical protein
VPIDSADRCPAVVPSGADLAGVPSNPENRGFSIDPPNGDRAELR